MCILVRTPFSPSPSFLCSRFSCFSSSFRLSSSARFRLLDRGEDGEVGERVGFHTNTDGVLPGAEIEGDEIRPGGLPRFVGLPVVLLLVFPIITTPFGLDPSDDES